MRTRRRLAATLAILVVGALIAGPIAIARRGGETVGPALPELTAVETSSRENDTRPKGLNIGDTFVLRQDVSAGGRGLGTAEVSCSYLAVGRTARKAPPNFVTLQCTGLLLLGPGALTFQGLNSFVPAPGAAPMSRFVVTGGAGVYAGAVGEIRATELGGGRSTLVLDLAAP